MTKTLKQTTTHRLTVMEHQLAELHIAVNDTAALRSILLVIRHWRNKDQHMHTNKYSTKYQQASQIYLKHHTSQ